jgi:hypothetical protein
MESIIVKSYTSADENRDVEIRKLWERKMDDVILRNWESKVALESFMKKEIGGFSFKNMRDYYSIGSNQFFIAINTHSMTIEGCAGIHRYEGDVFEINKLCLTRNQKVNDTLLNTIIDYYEQVIKKRNEKAELQTVIEKKNTGLYEIMLKRNFIPYHKSRNNVNVYMKKL